MNTALVLGFDGFDLDLVHELGPTRLPALHALMAEGAYAALESVSPPATLPNWTTFLTGADPGAHGVFDFTTRQGYGVRFSGGTVRETSTLFARLDRMGVKVACLGFPGTYPPEPLTRGVFMSGWDAPVAFEADRSFVHPPALYDELTRRFGAIRFDDVDEFHADREGFHRDLPGVLVRRIDRKLELARHLLRSREIEVLGLYFGESDTASHHLHSLHDARSPRNPGYVTDGLAQVYEALDRAAATLREMMPGAELTIVSDHGSGGSSDVVLHLNRALEEAGLLRFRPSPGRPSLASRAKDIALTRFPPKLRERVFRFGDALLPSWLESKARFGAIDFERTVAFSDELNYFPAVHLNLEGREPRGVVPASKREEAILRVEAALKALRDPWNGQPVVRAVHRREALYSGPFVHRAPDLVLDLALRDGYSYNLMPTPRGRDVDTFTRLDPSEHLGRKGRSMPGSHRPRGFFLAHGASVEAVGECEATIADASATLLARLGVKPAPDASGRVLFEILADSLALEAELPEASFAPKHGGNASFLEKRLRALGYVD
jgi:predicted AlkP superfamily phosphohydrolase/phosphomutase